MSKPESQTTKERVLKAADDWAKEILQGEGSPPWEWFYLMKLREAIQQLTGPMEIPIEFKLKVVK